MDENPSNLFFFFHDPLVPRGLERNVKGARGYDQISDWYVDMWYICYYMYCYCIARQSLGTLMYLKTKTLNNHDNVHSQ